ncbi:hypothetical protein ACFL58_01150 [Elusimicrobiota bacterium]
MIAISSFVIGILLDLDHVSDYWREHPFKMDLIHFFETCQESKLKKIYLWLHSIELIIPLVIIVYFTRSELFLGMFIGFMQHLIFDQFFNPIYPQTYSLFYRFKVKFENKKVFNFKEKTSWQNQKNILR